MDTNPDVSPAEASSDLTTNGIRDEYTLLKNFGAGNFFWAEVIDTEILQKNDKALVYTGVGHAYTRFFHQRSEDNGFTVGNLIYDAIGSLAFTIDLHGSASDGRVELAQRIEKLFAHLPEGQRRMGVDTKSSGLGTLPVTSRGYLFGKGRCNEFTLADIADGYIYLAPIDEWKPVTFRADFITKANYDRVEKQWRSDRPRDRRYTIEEMKNMAEAAIRNQYLYQQGRLPGNE